MTTNVCPKHGPDHMVAYRCRRCNPTPEERIAQLEARVSELETALLDLRIHVRGYEGLP